MLPFHSDFLNNNLSFQSITPCSLQLSLSTFKSGKYSAMYSHLTSYRKAGTWRQFWIVWVACRGNVFRNKKQFSDAELKTISLRWFLSNNSASSLGRHQKNRALAITRHSWNSWHNYVIAFLIKEILKSKIKVSGTFIYSPESPFCFQPLKPGLLYFSNLI